MSFDKIFVLTAGVYFNFYNKKQIGVSHTACKDEFRQNLRFHSWSAFFFIIKHRNTVSRVVVAVFVACGQVIRDRVGLSQVGFML